MLPSRPILRSTVKKTVFCALVSLLCLACSSKTSGQITLPFNRERSAMDKIAARQWFQARNLLQTALRKDPQSAEARYAFAVYFSTPANPRYNLDSARINLREAASLFRELPPKEQEKLRKFPLDSAILAGLGKDITAQAYKLTVARNSIEAFSEFLSDFPEAEEKPLAIEHRDSLAFEHARADGSPEAWLKFLTDWPESVRKNLAAARYEEGMFLRRTLSGTPEDLRRFLKEFPASPYRETIIEKLFRLLTIAGTADQLQGFAKEFPDSRYARVANDLIAWRSFHPGHGRWIPIGDKGLFGFMNLEGKVVIKPSLLQLPEAYRCPPGDTGLVVLPDAVYDRTGRKIIDGNYSNARHLGSGFVLAVGNSGPIVIHASGWRPIDQPVTDAFMIGQGSIAFKNAKGWGIRSVNGVSILADEYDTIGHSGDLLMLRKNNRYYLMPQSRVIDIGRNNGDFMVADEVRILKPGAYLVRTGDAQEVVNDRLEPLVDIGIQRISATTFGFRIDRGGLTTLTGWPGLEKKQFRSVEFRDPWMKTVMGDSSSLYHIPGKVKVLSSPDSLWFSRSFLFARKKDSVHVFTPDNKRITVGRSDITAFQTASDSSMFFLVRKKKQLVLYDLTTGKRLFSGAYEDIIPVTRNYFLVKLRNKTGLVNGKGKELVTSDYDAILYRNGWFSLLRQGKFGAFNPESGRMIKPVFEANLVPLSSTMIMARKKQKWGVIGPLQKPELASYPFDEITPLTDTLAMARVANLWSVLDLHSGKPIAGNITNWQEVRGAERVMLKSEGKYGMLSPNTGMVIKPQYEEILWWSDDQDFLFMGIRRENETHGMIEYFNRHGTVMRRQPVSMASLDNFICED